MVRLVCPWCGSAVHPGRTAVGDLLCPACGNTGVVRPPQPGRSAKASESRAGVVLAVALVVVLGAVAVLVGLAPWPSSGGDERGETVPAIAFSKQQAASGGTVTVVHAPGGLTWDDLAVSGDADCVQPVGMVDPGDVVTCSRAGSLDIVHRPTETLVYATTFE